MKVKKIVIYQISALIILLLAGACRRDELSVSKNNISRTWGMNKVEINDADSTTYWKNIYQNYSIQYTRDGKYIEEFSASGLNSYSEKGTWSFSEDALTLTRISENLQKTRRFNVIFLDESSLTLTEQDTSIKHKYFLVAKQ